MTLFEAVRATIRRLHDSPRTEEAYLHWIRALITYHARRHPRDMDASHITAFLNHLAVERRLSASTYNQALCAVVFLYERVLGLPVCAPPSAPSDTRTDARAPSSSYLTAAPRPFAPRLPARAHRIGALTPW